jgi:hypothetical protein
MINRQSMPVLKIGPFPLCGAINRCDKVTISR